MSSEKIPKNIFQEESDASQKDLIVERELEELQKEVERKDKHHYLHKLPKMTDDEYRQYWAEDEVNRMDNMGENDFTQFAILIPEFSKGMLKLIFEEMYKQKKECIIRLYLSEMEISDGTVDAICKLK